MRPDFCRLHPTFVAMMLSSAAVFAVIELDYAEADQDSSGEALDETEKHLTYYELDLGLNHVTRKWSEPISRTASTVSSPAVPSNTTRPCDMPMIRSQ